MFLTGLDDPGLLTLAHSSIKDISKIILILNEMYYVTLLNL